VNKTKVWSLATRGQKCNLIVNGKRLEQVKQYKYFGSIITDDRRCEKEVKSRIVVAKEAFW